MWQPHVWVLSTTMIDSHWMDSVWFAAEVSQTSLDCVVFSFRGIQESGHSRSRSLLSCWQEPGHLFHRSAKSSHCVSSVSTETICFDLLFDLFATWPHKFFQKFFAFETTAELEKNEPCQLRSSWSFHMRGNCREGGQPALGGGQVPRVVSATMRSTTNNREVWPSQKGFWRGSCGESDQQLDRESGLKWLGGGGSEIVGEGMTKVHEYCWNSGEFFFSSSFLLRVFSLCLSANCKLAGASGRTHSLTQDITLSMPFMNCPFSKAGNILRVHLSFFCAERQLILFGMFLIREQHLMERKIADHFLDCCVGVVSSMLVSCSGADIRNSWSSLIALGHWS